MASSTAVAGLPVPTVTLADLENFQQAHFDRGYGPSTTDTQSCLLNGSGTFLNSEEEEEDDLGYYPDGVKRTLTDDQVAMFRNSEIYSLRRKRQIQEENREADGGSGTAAEAVERSPQSLDYPSKEDLEKRRGSENSDGTEGTEDIVQKRQKRDENGKKSSCSEAPPSRRQIRELDGMITGVDYLDYGEEPSVSQGTKHGAVLDLPSQPHGEYAGYGIQNDAREIKTTESPKQGRKIWWPSIG